MLKLRRYLKPFIAAMLLGVLLLFGQAALELNLPDMMSRIVNIGIEQGGITEIAPQAIPQDYFALLMRFMDEPERAFAEVVYPPLKNAQEKNSLTQKFPQMGEYDYVLVEGKILGEAQQAALDESFVAANQALVQLLTTVSQQSGEQVLSSSTNEASIDLEALDALLPRLQELPQSAFDEAAAQAKTALAQANTKDISPVLNKAYYRKLGANTDAIQNAYILRTGGMMLLLCLIGVGCAAGAGLFFSRLGAGVARDLRLEVYQKVTGFTNNEMDHFSTASLITRTTNDITQVQMLLTMGTRILFFAPIMGIGGIVMALRKSSGMAWIIAVAVLVIVGTIALLFSIAMPRFKRMQSLIDRLNLVSRENLSGMMVIRAFGTQSFEEKRFDQANKTLADNSLFANRVITIMMPVMTLVMNSLTLFIVWIGGHQIAASAMQVGDMMAFIQYSMQIIMSFLMISMMFIMIPRATVSAQRICEVLDSDPAIKDPLQPKTLGKRAQGEIVFHDVSFRYAGADENVLDQISFTAKPGEITAFIGSTGSGKSTLINLIPRFYDVSAGSITLDGIDIRELPQKELRDAIGYVPQKGVLFTGDISSNLRYGDQHADETLLRQAAEIAQANEFIDKLPEGFATPISQGGSNVSGGQRQRLAIARALVRHAPVYIFDDSFSALDFATDAKLRRALAPYTRDAAVLLVAQRVSTIMQADQIVVLDEGRIAGIGTHSHLLQNCPTYREIAQSQLSKEELS